MITDAQPLIDFISAQLPMLQDKAREIAGRFEPVGIKKQDLIVTEGKTSEAYYFLLKGFVRAYTYDLKGKDTTTHFYSGNQMVGELFSFFKRVPAKENFQALTDCQAWRIRFEDLQVAFHSMPEFREFGRAMLVGAYADLKERMLSMLHLTAEERYNNLIISSPDIFQHASLKDIASYLGITNTSLSRIRKEISKPNAD
ncbi:MAG: Crp/Fnr family transcription regulator [Ferruginibacter sp.]|nr:Crp/Fnr family transcription regulator [Ferruginibacter sp.]